MLGVLKVVAARAHAFGDRDMRALRLMAGLMGTALDHAASSSPARPASRSAPRRSRRASSGSSSWWTTRRKDLRADERDQATYINQRLADLLACPKGEILGRPFTTSSTSPRAPPPARCSPAGRTARAPAPTSAFAGGDGEDLWAIVSASPLVRRDGARVGTVAMITDVTERRRTEERLRRSAERLAMLHDVDHAVLAGRPPADIARVVLARLRRVVPYRRAEVVLFEPDREEAVRLAAVDGGEPLAGRPGAARELRRARRTAAWRGAMRPRPADAGRAARHDSAG